MKALAVLTGVLLACTAAAAASEPQALPVPSIDRRGDAVIVMPGFWFPATAPAPAPAVVLLHGCSGPYDRAGRLTVRLRDYAALLNALGLHALVVDSLTPRGETELCTQPTDRRSISQLHRRRDALGALQWLAAQPGVDASRLGLIGWSHGGSTVLATLQRGQAEVAAQPVRPAFAVAFYPGCADALRRRWQPAAPLLMLLGDADDWTPAAPCQALARQAGTPAVQLETYAGAHHGFDGTAPLRLLRNVPNGVNPGQGVHVGGDPAARAASLERLQAFLREQFGRR